MLPKILTTAQTQSADRYTIEHQGISSLDLMERAASALFDAVEPLVKGAERIAVLAGHGNNGGDALVLARLLDESDVDVDVYLLQAAILSTDCATNLSRLKPTVTIIEQQMTVPTMESYDIVIDGLLGSGLTRVIDKGIYADAVQGINASGAYVVSIDLPSGLFADKRTPVDASIVQADHVVTFQTPKLIELLPEGSPYIGTWQVVDIRLDQKYLWSVDSDLYVLDRTVADLLQPRSRYSHKGTYGHTLVMAGSKGKAGAAMLTAKASLRSGSGLVTVALPHHAMPIMQTAVPEVMCLPDRHQDVLTEVPDLSQYKALAVGPGIGQNPLTVKMLDHLLVVAAAIPMVLDADALNILATQSWLSRVPRGAVLTPHPKEMERLVGSWTDSWHRMALQQELAAKTGSVIVYKDAHTCIAAPNGELYFNTSGNPGMATGGSGDVLTGIIAGLLAQSYTPLAAALLGVYFHGVAGDMAAIKRGEASLIASDIIDELVLV